MACHNTMQKFCRGNICKRYHMHLDIIRQFTSIYSNVTCLEKRTQLNTSNENWFMSTFIRSLFVFYNYILKLLHYIDKLRHQPHQWQISRNHSCKFRRRKSCVLMRRRCIITEICIRNSCFVTWSQSLICGNWYTKSVAVVAIVLTMPGHIAVYLMGEVAVPKNQAQRVSLSTKQIE